MSQNLNKENKKPAVTVLMPVYNSEKYLKEAIDSILNQTFSDFILLLINDCSTDKSEEIILSYKDPRIKYLKNEKNLGLVGALNRGLEVIDTEYIVRMDSDDISVLNRFEIQKTFMDAHPDVGVSSCALERFGDDKGIWTVPLSNDEIKSSLVFASSITHAPCIIRTKVLLENNIRYRDTHIHMEDYDLWFRLKDFTQYQNIADVLYKYRVENHNVTVLNANTAIERKKSIYKWILSYLKIEPSDDELLLHIGFGKGRLSPTVVNIVKYRKWLDKLIEKNNELNYFEKISFVKVAENRWTNLFFILPEYSYKSVWTYIKLSKGLSGKQFSYLLKYTINKYILMRP